MGKEKKILNQEIDLTIGEGKGAEAERDSRKRYLGNCPDTPEWSPFDHSHRCECGS